MSDSHTRLPCQRVWSGACRSSQGPTCSVSSNARCDLIGPCPFGNESIVQGPPKQIRELFTLTRTSGVRAVCSLWTHPCGWEIRLLVNDTFIRSLVVRDPTDIQRIANEWRVAMIREGWTTR
jgi:hypothetical protein